MTAMELISRILEDGPTTKKSILEQMRKKGIDDANTNNVLEGLEVRGQIEIREGVIYKRG